MKPMSGLYAVVKLGGVIHVESELRSANAKSIAVATMFKRIINELLPFLPIVKWYMFYRRSN